MYGDDASAAAKLERIKKRDIERRRRRIFKRASEATRNNGNNGRESAGWSMELGGQPLALVHRRASRTAQFRKVCRSKNSNGRSIAAVKWRTIVLVNHYIKILYHPPRCRTPPPMISFHSASFRFSRHPT